MTPSEYQKTEDTYYATRNAMRSEIEHATAPLRKQIEALEALIAARYALGLRHLRDQLDADDMANGKERFSFRESRRESMERFYG